MAEVEKPEWIEAEEFCDVENFPWVDRDTVGCIALNIYISGCADPGIALAAAEFIADWPNDAELMGIFKYGKGLICRYCGRAHVNNNHRFAIWEYKMALRLFGDSECHDYTHRYFF